MAIQKAADACRTNGQVVTDQFVASIKMVPIGSGAERPLDDYPYCHRCQVLGKYPRRDPKTRFLDAGIDGFRTIKALPATPHSLAPMGRVFPQKGRRADTNVQSKLQHFPARGDAGTYPSRQRDCVATASLSAETQGDASPLRSRPYAAYRTVRKSV